jgi:hypothetical protein
MLFGIGLLTVTTTAKPLHVVDIERCAAFADRHDVIEVNAACLMAGLADRLPHQDIPTPLSMLITVMSLSARSFPLYAWPEGLD